MTRLFGDRSVRTWDEICAILDKTENRWVLSGEWLSNLSRKVRQSPATVQRMVDWAVGKSWLAVEEISTDGLPLVYSSPSYWKYHKKKGDKGETKGETKGAGVGSSLPFPSEPSLLKDKERERAPRKRGYPEDFKISESVRRWAKQLGVVPEIELEGFRDYHVSKGSVFTDWDAAFRTWLRNARRFGRNGRPGVQALPVSRPMPTPAVKPEEPAVPREVAKDLIHDLVDNLGKKFKP